MQRMCTLTLVTSPALSLSVVGLERALMQYCSQPNEQPFDIKTVPIETTQDKPKCKQYSVVLQNYPR